MIIVSHTPASNPSAVVKQEATISLGAQQVRKSISSDERSNSPSLLTSTAASNVKVEPSVSVNDALGSSIRASVASNGIRNHTSANTVVKQETPADLLKQTSVRQQETRHILVLNVVRVGIEQSSQILTDADSYMVLCKRAR